MNLIIDGIYVVSFSFVDEKGEQHWNRQSLLVVEGMPYLLRPDRKYGTSISEVPPDAYALEWEDLEDRVHPLAPYKIPIPIPVLRPGRN